jgi:exopolysaccharide production protein ExoQ
MTEISWRRQPKGKRKMPQLLLAWLLMVPLVVLAVHTQFSFLQGSRNSDEGQGIASLMAAPDAGVSIVFRVLFYAAYAAILWLICTNLSRVLRAISQCKPALLVCGIVLASVIWSQDPVASLRGGLYYLVDTLFAFYLLSTFSLEELMELIMMAGATLAILSAVMIVAFPQYGLVQETAHHGVWQGIFSEKNDAAKNWIFLLTPVCNRRIFQPRSMLYAGMVLLFLGMTKSVTAIIALAVYLAFMMCLPFFRRLSLRSAAFSIAVAVLITVLSVSVLIEIAPQLAGLLGRDLTLTGRTDIWAVLLQSVQKHPVLGYGYSAFWTGMVGESGLVYMTIHWYFTYAHNGFLEVLLQVGMIGMAAVALMLLQAAANALVCVRHEDSPGIDWLVGLIFLTLLYNIDEGTMLFTHSLVSVIFVMSCGGLAMARARLRDRGGAAAATVGQRAVEAMGHA